LKEVKANINDIRLDLIDSKRMSIFDSVHDYKIAVVTNCN
jgi:hypothetical protein